MAQNRQKSSSAVAGCQCSYREMRAKCYYDWSTLKAATLKRDKT